MNSFCQGLFSLRFSTKIARIATFGVGCVILLAAAACKPASGTTTKINVTQAYQTVSAHLTQDLATAALVTPLPSQTPAPPQPKKSKSKLYICTEDTLAQVLSTPPEGRQSIGSLSEMIATLCDAHQEHDTHRFDITVHGPTGQFIVKRIAVGAAPLKLLKKIGGSDFKVAQADSFKEEKAYVLINQKKEKKAVEEKKEPAMPGGPGGGMGGMY